MTAKLNLSILPTMHHVNITGDTHAYTHSFSPFINQYNSGRHCYTSHINLFFLVFYTTDSPNLFSSLQSVDNFTSYTTELIQTIRRDFPQIYSAKYIKFYFFPHYYNEWVKMFPSNAKLLVCIKSLWYTYTKNSYSHVFLFFLNSNSYQR